MAERLGSFLSFASHNHSLSPQSEFGLLLSHGDITNIISNGLTWVSTNHTYHLCHNHFCEASTDVIDVPLLAMLYKRPAEGLPILHSWVSVLKGILLSGFESWREMVEVKWVQDPAPLDQPLGYASILPVKGLGRVSMILWAVMFTYNNLDLDAMGEASKSDFLRPLREIPKINPTIFPKYF